MSVDSSPLMAEVLEVLEFGSNPRATYKIIVYTDDFEFESCRLIGSTIGRNFAQKFNEDYRLTLTCNYSDYDNYILSQRRVLRIKIIKTVSGGDPVVRTFNAFLLEDGNDDIVQNSPLDSAAKSNLTEKEFEIQAYDPVAKLMTGHKVGFVLKDVTMVEAIKTAYHSVGNEIGEVDGNKLIGIDMVNLVDRPFVKESAIIVKADTDIKKLCQTLQSDPMYGIYPSGVSRFYLDGHLSVFPTYNTDRYGLEDGGLKILALPSNRMPDIENSHRSDGRNLTVVVVGNSTLSDTSEAGLFSVGNGYRQYSGKSLFENPGVVTEDTMKISATDHRRSKLVIEREDGLIIAPASTNYIGEASYENTEAIARVRGQYLTVQWDNSNSDLLRPGMPVEYKYYQDDTAKTLMGVLHQVEAYSNSVGRTSDEYMEMSVLTLFLSTGLE